MLVVAAVGVLVLQLAAAQHEHRYIKFPVSPGHDGECYDHRVGQYYAVGETWGPRYANCKQSRCVQDGEVLYIDRLSCDRIRDNIDFAKIKENNYSCRQAIGDRREPFPGCCPQLVCYEYVDGKRVRLPEERLPLLKPIIEDHFVYVGTRQRSG